MLAEDGDSGTLQNPNVGKPSDAARLALWGPQDEAAEASTGAGDAEQQALVLAPERAEGTEAEAGQAANVAGGAIDVDEGDEAAVCGALFKGLVFFMGCDTPQQTLNPNHKTLGVGFGLACRRDHV